MKESAELQTIKDLVRNITKEEAQRIVKKLSGPPTKKITGKEYDHVMTMLRLVKPVNVSNNQVTETEKYIVGNTEYHITYFPVGEPELEEILKEENE